MKELSELIDDKFLLKAPPSGPSDARWLHRVENRAAEDA
jgi:hypothetical protein